MAGTLRSIGANFPDYGWSWPSGNLDQLLKAVLLSDEQAAHENAAAWLDINDINIATAREHRLLAAISDRFGKRLAAHPAYLRLAGMQKLLWTRSRMAMHEAAPALSLMADAGCSIMLFKGASRVAIDPSAQRGRVAHDIDLLVRPQDIVVAFELLRDNGWLASTGASPQYVGSRLPALRSMNFFKGKFGDIDLHRFAYDVSQDSAEDDLAMWDRAIAAQFCAVAVLVPSPADRIALAIAHGGLDAHTHSDWLVDCAVAIAGGGVDWSILLDIVRKRGLAVPTAIALSYLRLEIGVPVPEDALQEIVALADRSGLSRWSSLLQAKPRPDFGALSWLSRGLAKQMRLKKKRIEREDLPADVVWSGRRAWHAAPAAPATFVLSQKIPLPSISAGGGEIQVDVRVAVSIPPVRRRVEMEINTAERHVARLRYRTFVRAGGTRLLHFRGSLRLKAGETEVIIEARSSRHFRDWTAEGTVATYGALPFHLVSLNFSEAR